MAGERQLPGLGLYGFWTPGSNGWDTQNDSNIRTLSALVQSRVTSIAASEPGSPSNGDIHIASASWGGGAANDIMVRDNGSWVAITPAAGWTTYNAATGKRMVFDGTDWFCPDDPRIVTDSTTAYSLTAADLDGRTIIELSNAGSITLTLTAGLTGTRPVTVINTGGGTITLTEDSGVTLNAVAIGLTTQWGAATIIPKGSDVFIAVGNLETP